MRKKKKERVEKRKKEGKGSKDRRKDAEEIEID